MTKYEIISTSEEIQQKLLRSFQKKFEKKGSTDCWPWLGATCTGYGYVAIPFTTLQIYAHRLAWFFDKQAWPAPGHIICHTCNNKKCVNPAHLYEGDNSSNAKDRESQYDTKPACACGRRHL